MCLPSLCMNASAVCEVEVSTFLANAPMNGFSQSQSLEYRVNQSRRGLGDLSRFLGP